MNKNTIWIVCILIFVFVTVFVLSLDNTTNFRRVKITNQNFEITHENTQIVNEDSVKINNSNANITNKEISAKNTDIAIKDSSTKVNNQIIKILDDSSLARRETQFNKSESRIIQEPDNAYSKLDDLDSILKNAKNNVGNHTNQKMEPMEKVNPDQYGYADLDWNTWHSNFVNRILDDSIAIHELDQYGEGTWFYYSFKVHSNGAITNIVVRSIYLTPEDREKLVRFIKSYQYKNITRFPKGSKRQEAKVSAVMVLSNKSQYATPKDFSDGERVKIKVK